MSEPTAEWVGGVHAVLALLKRAPERVLEVCLDRRRNDRAGQQVEATARGAGIKLKRVPRAELDSLVRGINHQGVAAWRSPVGYRALDTLLDEGEPGLLLALDGVTDPRNLGAILRSGWAFGVGAVIVARHRAAGLTPAVIKTAAGAADVVPVCRDGNLKQSLGKLREAGYRIYGAAGEASVRLEALDLTGKLAVVLGAEDKGLRRTVRMACDELFRIPMNAEAGSVNVAVAAGIILARAYEARNAV